MDVRETETEMETKDVSHETKGMHAAEVVTGTDTGKD